MDIDEDLDNAEKDLNANLWLKWADGPHVLRFTGGVEPRRVHWIGGKPTDCTGSDCPICPTVAKGDGREAQHSRVYDVETDSGEPGKLDLRRPALAVLVPIMKDFRTEHGASWKSDFLKQWYRAERKGVGKGTTYKFTPVDAPERKPSDEIPF